MEVAAISVSLFFFGLGSAFDLKKREVSDKLWLIYGPLGLILTLAELFFRTSSAMLVTASITLATIVSLGLFYFGLLGGADAKAVICLAITMPLAPQSYESMIGYVQPFFPIVVVMTGFICSASTIVWFGLANLLRSLTQPIPLFDGLQHEPSWKKMLAAITGYPADISKLRSTFYLYPMETVEEDSVGSQRRFQLFVSAEAEREELISSLTGSLQKVGSPDKVWVTPGLPMLLFILIGLIITLVLGDPIFSGVLKLAKH